MSIGAVAGCWLDPVTFVPLHALPSRHRGQRRIFLCQSYLIEIRSSVAICSQYCEERAWLILAPDKTILYYSTFATTSAPSISGCIEIKHRPCSILNSTKEVCGFFCGDSQCWRHIMNTLRGGEIPK